MMMVPDFKATAGLPQNDQGPVFNAPWEASIFAIAVKLCEDGHFTWPEWVSMYSHEIAEVESRARADEKVEYYKVWLLSLEKMMTTKRLLEYAAIDFVHEKFRAHQAGDHDHDHDHDHGHSHHHQHHQKNVPVFVG